MTNITLIGRLTKDPSTRQAGNGSVVQFTVAVDNWGTDRGTSYFDCCAWSKTGEFVMNYLTKGRLVAVTGRMESRKHDDKTYWTVTAEQVKGLDKPTEKANAPAKSNDDYNPFEDE